MSGKSRHPERESSSCLGTTFSFQSGNMRFNFLKISIVDTITLFVLDLVLPPFPAPLQGLAFSVERMSVTLSLPLTSLGVVLFIIDSLSSPLDSVYSACMTCSFLHDGST